MDWQLQLITLDLAVCQFWQDGGWTLAQRHSPYANLSFTDEEAVTIHLFGLMENHRRIKDIHQHARRYWREWFPRLPGYGAYVQRLNRLADCLPALVERFCETSDGAAATGLIDSMPICLARQGHRFKAKVAPEMATVGYCSTKKLYYYGVKVHLIADQQFRTLLPLPRFIGITPARLNAGYSRAVSRVRQPIESIFSVRITTAQEFSNGMILIISLGTW